MEVAGVQVGPQGASRVRPSPGRHQTFTGAKVIPMMGFTARRCQTATSITGDIMHRMSLLYEGCLPPHSHHNDRVEDKTFEDRYLEQNEC